MSTFAYNDYVLTSSLQAGWITEDQHQMVLAALQRFPGVAALDFMVEQQILPPQHAEVLANLIAQAEAQHAAAAPAPAAAPAAQATQPAPAPASPAVITAEGPDKLEHVDDYLRFAVKAKASDLHLGPDVPATVRVHGKLNPIFEGIPRFSKEETERLARGFLTDTQARQVEEGGSVDFCYDIPGVSRFRASVVRQRRGWESVFRVINARVPTMEELGLPEILHSLIKFHNGLILVTGAVASGKSTTLAALIGQINRERKDHIITLEDPIEYVHTSASCQVTQREIHSHTDSFATALRASLREDPDVIMVGEMRDLETISLAITASETGHLVLGTLHTSTAPRTLDRLLDVFPIEQQSQIRTMVSESIRGIVCQQLVPRFNAPGRVLALEIMTNTPAIANLIREAKTFMLPGIMQTGKKLGMRLMDDSLMDLFKAKLISAEEAYQRAENKKLMGQGLAGG